MKSYSEFKKRQCTCDMLIFFISDGVKIALSTHGLGNIELFHDVGSYHIENNPSICSTNQWTGFFMIGASVMKELITCIITCQRCNHRPLNIHNGTFDKNNNIDLRWLAWLI